MAIQVGFEVDVSGFRKGMDQVKAASASIATGVGGVMKGAAAAFAGASAAVVVAAKGMYDAMSKGGELVDLSEQTGLAVDKLMELQVAFDQAGLGADEVGSVVNKMQRSIADAADGSATGQAMFAGLGLSLQQLGQMDAAGQLEEVGSKIMAIEDPTKRSAAAMEIFGKSGGRMLALFASGGLSGAQEALGGQAQLMAQNAAYFDEITDKLGTAALKVQGFFVGLAAALVPDLMAAADAINGINFDKLGVQIGNSVAILVELFKSNKLGDAFLIGMQIAALKVGQYISSILTKAIVMAIAPFLVLAEGGFWKGMLNTLQSGFGAIISTLQIGVGEAMKTIGSGISQIPGLKGAGEAVSGVGGAMVDMGQMGLEDAQKNLDDGMNGFAEAISNAGEQALGMFENMDLAPMQDQIDSLTAELSGMVTTATEQVAKNRENLKKPETKEKGDGLKVIPPKVNSQSFEAITSSLGKIGGGGISRGTLLTISPMVDQQKETNKLLRQNNQLMIQAKTVTTSKEASIYG